MFPIVFIGTLRRSQFFYLADSLEVGCDQPHGDHGADENSKHLSLEFVNVVHADSKQCLHVELRF